jgi:hypothetical protein
MIHHSTSCDRPEGTEMQLLLIIDFGTKRGWVVSVTPRLRFTLGERTPGTHWIGGWMGLRAGMNTEARGIILCLCRGSNPKMPSYSIGIGRKEPAFQTLCCRPTFLYSELSVSKDLSVTLSWNGCLLGCAFNRPNTYLCSITNIVA